jgi:hypothetical protein
MCWSYCFTEMRRYFKFAVIILQIAGTTLLQKKYGIYDVINLLLITDRVTFSVLSAKFHF